jgi:hypothetical protein
MTDEPSAEAVETQCAECLEPMTYLWVPGGGIVSSPEYVLVADWIFHSNCWERVMERGNQGDEM